MKCYTRRDVNVQVESHKVWKQCCTILSVVSQDEGLVPGPRPTSLLFAVRKQQQAAWEPGNEARLVHQGRSISHHTESCGWGKWMPFISSTPNFLCGDWLQWRGCSSRCVYNRAVQFVCVIWNASVCAEKHKLQMSVATSIGHQSMQFSANLVELLPNYGLSPTYRIDLVTNSLLQNLATALHESGEFPAGLRLTWGEHLAHHLKTTFTEGELFGIEMLHLGPRRKNRGRETSSFELLFHLMASIACHLVI